MHSLLKASPVPQQRSCCLTDLQFFSIIGIPACGDQIRTEILLLPEVNGIGLANPIS